MDKKDQMNNEVRRCVRGVCVMLLTMLLASAAMAQSGPWVLERGGRVISLEPYAPNILRVTMSVNKTAATSGPGYGFVATPSSEGWTHERDTAGYEVFRSGRLTVQVAPGDLPKEKLPQPMSLEDLNSQLRDIYFGGGGGVGPYNDALQVTTSDGKVLLQMRTWN